MGFSLRTFAAVALTLAITLDATAQEGSSIPSNIRGREDATARGVLDGNLIETNFRNYTEFANINDTPMGIWPRGQLNRHIDGIGMSVGARVHGHRAKYPDVFGGVGDTVLNPISMHYFDGITQSPRGDIWGWLPLPGFHNPLRVNTITGLREPTPALSDDPTSWPEFWPDKSAVFDDPGWAGSWNGIFGKVITADLETYYVVDDLGAFDYGIDGPTNRPYSVYGVFYADPADSTIGGLGLQVEVRALQWANVLAEDTMFIIYRITNVGGTNYGEYLNLPCAVWEGTERTIQQGCESGLHLTQFSDYGLGWEENDEGAAFDPQLDIAWGWDNDGIGTRETGSTYQLGVTGFAFLESPVRRENQADDDEDGVIDEDRFSGPGTLIEGQDAIRSYAETNYDMVNFERVNGPIENTRAFHAGRWWTGDEDMDWLGYTDGNNNGQWDAGEFLNDDYGVDGLGPNDLGYPGRDEGEGDGRPDVPEPNFDETDIDEGDQIGLTGVHITSGELYWQTDAMADDTWMWARIQENQFPIGSEPVVIERADVQPWLTWDSGPIALAPQSTDFFSSGWIFGWDEADFLRNRNIVQTIYNADYRFAQPPHQPQLTAQVGDGYVVLSWDTLALASFDRFSQTFDFEGFRLYRATDPLFSDVRQVSDFAGTPTFYKPLAQWDLRNGIRGRDVIMNGDAVFDLGEDTGLQFSYIDRDVTNGKTYYYAIAAYDHGYEPTDDSPDPNAVAIDPQENVFTVTVDQGGQIRGFTPNVAVVTPRSDAAGYIEASTNEDLSSPTGSTVEGRGPRGTGSVSVTIVDQDQVNEDHLFRLTFFDTTNATGTYETTAYELRNMTTNEVLLPRQPLRESTPSVSGLTVQINNDEPAPDPLRTGWVGVDENGDEVISSNPFDLQNFATNWVAAIRQDNGQFFVVTTDEYELTYTTDSLYAARAFTGGYIASDVPFWCRNVTKDQPCDLLVRDDNESGVYDVGDVLIISERQGIFGARMFRFQVGFNTAGGESFAPPNGSVVRISQRLPFATGDYFEFTLRPSYTDVELARSQLDEVAVVPNPYMTAAEWEPAVAITGRGPRQIQFINLPEVCTIRIFTIRGELVRTIEHVGEGGHGAEWWDLKTENEQDVAYGMYLFHVEAPNIGETTGKFAIVK